MSEINIPERHDYEPIKPFRLFVKNNFPFIESTYEALDNYGLYCKLVEYLNQVINEQNKVSADMVTFTDFVTNYFENLDVQEEINNKLDEMAEDGTLSALIGVYIDNIVQPQLNQLNNKVDSLASGSPANVYDTLSDLQADNPDHSKIYLVTATGNWYYYNTDTSAWTSGGTYQASIDSNTIKQLTEKNKAIAIGHTLLELDWENGGFDTNDGISINPYSTTRIYSNEYIKGDGYSHLIYETDGSYQLWLFKYDSVGNFIEETGYSHDKFLDILLEENYQYRFNIYLAGGIDKTTALLHTSLKIAYYSQNNVFYVGANRTYTTLKSGIEQATKYKNSTVYVDAGTYDIITEYGSEYFENYSANINDCGIVLKNGVHVIFSPHSFVTCNYTGSNTDVQSYFSVFNVGKGGFTLEGLKVQASNIRYIIHDDITFFGGGTEYCKTSFINCDFDFDNLNNSEWQNYSAIGGGLGYNSDVLIENCIIKTTANQCGTTNGGISYHQCGTAGSQSKIVVKDNYFVNRSDRINFITLGTTTRITDIICTNNSGYILPYKTIAPNTSDSFNLLLWNNNVRT